MATLKPQPAVTKAARPRTNPSIQDLYRAFCKNLKDVSVVDPQNRTIVFRIENFPYLIKMQSYNAPESKWVAATASVVIRALEDGSFDETKHRFDPTRARGLLRIREILTAPDSIHKNIHPRVNGDLVYVVRIGGAKGAIKVAFITRNRANEWVLVTSFYTTERYIKTCAKEPPLYKK